MSISGYARQNLARVLGSQTAAQSIINAVDALEAGGATEVMGTKADSAAANGELYYSSDQSALAYKVASGKIAPLNAVATAYVGPAGDDGNAGTRAAPFLTLRAALTAVGAGGKVIALDGDYANLVLAAGDAGADGARTIIQAENKHKAKITGDATYHGVDVATGANYVTLDGFELTSSAGVTDGVKVQATNCIVQNCWIHDTGGQGIISTVGATSSIYRNNHIEDCGTDTGDHGIYNVASSVTIHDNLIHGCSGYGIHCYGSPGQSNTDIYRNHCHSNTTGPAYLVGPEAGGACGHTVRDNLLDNAYGTSGAACITISDCESASLTGNVFIVHAVAGPVVLEIGGCVTTTYTGNIEYTQLADINTHGAYSVADLITNGGFETAGGGGAAVFDSWVNTESASTVTSDSVEQDTGDDCCKITMSASTYASIKQTGVMVVGDAYTLTLRAKCDSTPASLATQGPVLNLGALSTVYETYRTTFVATSVDLEIGRAVATDKVMYIDNVSLVQAYGPSPGDIARCTPQM